MKYNELDIQPHKSSKRLGRGIASGRGKTAGRGTKGQGSRTGSTRRPGFEGGQNPLMQQLPKLHGFNTLKIKSENVFIGQLEQFANKIVDTVLLSESKLISNPYVNVKLLVGKGELTKKVTVKLASASVKAVEIVQKNGGSFEKVPRIQRAAIKPKKS